MQRSSQAPAAKRRAGRQLSCRVAHECRAFLRPWLADLDRQVDRRLVRTAQAAGGALVHSHCAQALLLSELGALLAGPRHAPAGTKWLANLVHSCRTAKPRPSGDRRCCACV